MSTLYSIVYKQVYCECMYKSIDGLMVSNSVKVETECVRKSVNCVHIVFNTVHNSTCTVAGPNTCSKLSIELLRSYTLAKSHVCSLALDEKGCTLCRKYMCKKIRSVIVYREWVLGCRKNALRYFRVKYL